MKSLFYEIKKNLNNSHFLYFFVYQAHVYV